ncbi:MAG: hypothetical protein V3U68_05080 [Bacteroidota bacterium]
MRNLGNTVKGNMEVRSQMTVQTIGLCHQDHNL